MCLYRFRIGELSICFFLFVLFFIFYFLFFIFLVYRVYFDYYSDAGKYFVSFFFSMLYYRRRNAFFATL